MAATTASAKAVAQVYNIAVGDRTSLNELLDAIRSSLVPTLPHLAVFKPSYRDFRAGDVLHSLADISKARHLLGYEPSHRIREGLSEAVAWYAQKMKRDDNSEIGCFGCATHS